MLNALNVIIMGMLQQIAGADHFSHKLTDPTQKGTLVSSRDIVFHVTSMDIKQLIVKGGRLEILIMIPYAYFSGHMRCYFCNKYGHVEKECRLNRSEKVEKFQHTVRKFKQIWKKKEDQSETQGILILLQSSAFEAYFSY